MDRAIIRAKGFARRRCVQAVTRETLFGSVNASMIGDALSCPWIGQATPHLSGDHLLLTMLYNTGVTVSEIIGIRGADVMRTCEISQQGGATSPLRQHKAAYRFGESPP